MLGEGEPKRACWLEVITVGFASRKSWTLAFALLSNGGTAGGPIANFLVARSDLLDGEDGRDRDGLVFLCDPTGEEGRLAMWVSSTCDRGGGPQQWVEVSSLCMIWTIGERGLKCRF